ncbi:uncharacterized protein LOC120171927 [Hibiscus syriacus]|uniref:uncharacterized protein LOC120171927 n=1 Tax=Hibiscus syriacus TaxID=106335 RepID=UPI001920D8B5|nr:uncharacterized protein LOC120171927 [Hibiscus syriacus]
MSDAHAGPLPHAGSLHHTGPLPHAGSLHHVGPLSHAGPLPNPHENQAKLGVFILRTQSAPAKMYQIGNQGIGQEEYQHAEAIPNAGNASRPHSIRDHLNIIMDELNPGILAPMIQTAHFELKPSEKSTWISTTNAHAAMLKMSDAHAGPLPHAGSLHHAGPLPHAGLLHHAGPLPHAGPLTNPHENQEKLGAS